MNSYVESTAERLGWALVQSLWQGVAIVIVLAVVLRMLRHRSAAVRHAACMLALAGQLAVAVLTAYRAPVSRTVDLPAVTVEAGSAASVVGIRAPLAAEDGGDDAAFMSLPAWNADAIPASGAPLEWRERFRPALPWLAAAWIAGVVFLSLRNCHGWLRIRAWRRAGGAVDETTAESFARLLKKFGLRGRVLLRKSADAFAPMLAGVLRPVILLPARVLTGLGAREIEAVLAHELAHFARRDTWMNLAQIFIETVLFYHPAVWWMSRQARIERENAADDLAVCVCEDRIGYASALAHLAEYSAVPEPALAATGGSLLDRIRRIVGRPERPEPTGWAAPAIAVVFAAALVVPLIAQNAAKQIKPGESIQAAIDAAQPGAVIELMEGVFDERITITKAITLKGAGWQKTVIKPSKVEVEPPEAEAESFAQRLAAAGSDAERDRLKTQWAERYPRPTVTVKNATVTLSGFRIGGIASTNAEAGSMPLVRFSRGKVSMRDCVVAGPAQAGIEITEGADVEVRGTLVTAVWGTGVSVSGSSTTRVSRLIMSESEVRNCYHRGVTIGAGCDTTLIEKCRISGSAWHGIRYDDASPAILQNIISGNARSGIYASGKTAATVRGNVFRRNEMNGMSCWNFNADTIEANVFEGNDREALSVLGGSKPIVVRNIFVSHPIAIVRGQQGGGASGSGEPQLSGNVFSKNENVVQLNGKDAPLPEGNIVQVETSQQLDVIAKAAGGPQGAEVLDAEKLIIPDSATRDYRAWRKPGVAATARAAAVQDPRRDYQTWDKARERAKSWVSDALQLDDTARRTAAIERTRAALTSKESDEIYAGLSAYRQIGSLKFDKASFREPFLALIAGKDDGIRSTAAGLLGNTGFTAVNLPLVAKLADDASPNVQKAAASLAVVCSGGDLTKSGADIILKLLNSPNNEVVIAAMHPLWGVKTTPEIQDRLVAYSRESFSGGPGRASYDAHYYGLSTSPNKTEATVKRLIELFSDPDSHNIGGRACWGLGQGVAPEQYALLSDALVKVIETRDEGYLRRMALQNLPRYGTSAQLPAINELLAKPGTDGEFRKTLESIAARLEQRRQ